MMPQIIDRSAQTEWFDDFTDFNSVATTGKWQITKGTGGTIALQDLPGGRLNVPTAASANDYVLLSSQKKIAQLKAGKPLWFEAQVNLTQANTNQANIVFGLSSILTTGFLVTGNGGLPTTWDGVVFWMVGGQTTPQWQFSSSRSTTVTTQATFTPFTSGADTRLGFHVDPADGVNAIVTPYFNDQPMVVSGANYTQKISLASSPVLYPIIGVLAGSSSAETLQIDYMRLVQDR